MEQAVSRGKVGNVLFDIERKMTVFDGDIKRVVFDIEGSAVCVVPVMAYTFIHVVLYCTVLHVFLVPLFIVSALLSRL